MKFKIPRSLNTYLRMKRIEHGLTQAELAKLLGYRAQFVTNWERGASSPPGHALRKLIEVLEIPEDEILELLFEESKRYWESLLRIGGSKTKASRRK